MEATEKELPTPEDTLYFLLWGFSVMAQLLHSSVSKTSTYKTMHKGLRTPVDNIQRHGKNLYHALRELDDQFSAIMPSDWERESRNRVGNLVTLAMNTVVNLPPERFNEWGALLDNFNSGQHRAVDTGVYEVIESLPHEPTLQMEELVLRYTREFLNPLQRKGMALGLQQMVAYQVATKLGEYGIEPEKQAA